MAKGYYGAWASLCLALLVAPCTQADEPLLGAGYLKSYGLWQDAVAPVSAEQWQWQNSLRLMLDYFPGARWSLQLHYELQPVYRDKPTPSVADGSPFSTLNNSDNRYRIDDIQNDDDREEDHWLLLHNLDRLNLRYSTEHGDLTVGRQVVSFGSARFINPTDIFVPFALQTLNQEYRVGIDAIRYQAVLGDFAQLDVGAVIGENAEKANSGAFLRGRDNWRGKDVQGVLIALDEAWLVGGGVETALGDFGVWLETAFVDAELAHYWRHSIGSDYALDARWVVMLEYHYNGAGARQPEDYAGLLRLQPYQRAGVYLLGQHYLIPALNWQASPLLNVTASGFFNLQDDSCFISLAAERSWSENLYSDVGVYWSTGDSLEPDSASATLQFGSEFGNYPVSLYASLRWYF